MTGTTGDAGDNVIIGTNGDDVIRGMGGARGGGDTAYTAPHCEATNL